MVQRRRASILWKLVLLLALLTLFFMVLRVTGWLPDAPAASLTTTLTGESPPSQAASLTFAPQPQPSDPRQVASVTPLPEGTLLPESPADDWANALLDQGLPLLDQVTPPAEGLAWWQSREVRGELYLIANEVILNGQIVILDPQKALIVSVTDPFHSGQLLRLGTAEPTTGSLLLRIAPNDASSFEQQWRLSSGDPKLALRALVAQALMREVALQAAYSGSGSSDTQLVLLGARFMRPTATPATSATPGPTAIPTHTPTPTITPSPTRAPEAYMGWVVAQKIDPVIDSVQDLESEITLAFMEQHPWTGLLTLSEGEIEVGGHPIAASTALELDFYTLELNDQSGSVTRFLTAVYTRDGTTRLPDDLIYFQGHRMEEIVYWMVVRAVEREGQLIVAYDDFGTRQGITVIGFLPFNE